MIKIPFILLFVLCSSKICFAAENYEIIQKSIPHLDQPNKNVEFYILRPKIDKKFPVVLYIHGFQKQEPSVKTLGAKASIDNGTLVSFANQGYLAIGISQPGFGNSDGPADFSGPFTQRAIITVIRHLQSSEFLIPIDTKKIVLGGVSRGAITASMVATQETNLAGLILDSGLYDLKGTNFPETLTNIKREVGDNLTNAQIQERSAIYHSSNLKMPVLLLHGYQDPRHPIKQAYLFYEAIMKTGSKSILVMFPAEHKTPKEDREWVTERFLKDIFKSNS